MRADAVRVRTAAVAPSSGLGWWRQPSFRKVPKNLPRKGHCGRIGGNIRIRFTATSKVQVRTEFDLCLYISPMGFRAIADSYKCFGICAL